ncbi:AlpA family phage regulatory protein [Bradyrhizobium sp. UFLA05-153]
MTKAKPSKPSRLIDRHELLRRIPLTWDVIYKLMKADDFPAARAVGGKSAWLESEIEQWVLTRPMRGKPPRGRLPLSAHSDDRP